MVSQKPAQLTYQQAAKWLAEVRFSQPFDPEALLAYIQENPNWLEPYSPQQRQELQTVLDDIINKSLA